MRKSTKTSKTEILKPEGEMDKVNVVEANVSKEEVITVSPDAEIKVSLKAQGIDRKILIFLSIFIVLIVLLAGFGVYFYLQYQSVQALAKNTNSSGVDVSKLVDKIGKLIELPKGEVPQVATVSDVSKLSGEEFFSKAKNGDIVLVFNNAKKAYLYRPSIEKLIEVGPVIGDNVQSNITTDVKPDVASASDSAEVEAQVEVIVLNGTAESGLTRKAEKTLVEKMKEIKVVKRENAQSNTYDETVVVDLSGNHLVDASKIAETLGGRIESDLPEGETQSGSEIVVILGSNFVE